jgi:hypothetical protein
MPDFEKWWATYGQPYEAAVIERGGTPSTTDLDERRALWARLYIRPSPPVGLFTTMKEIRR